MAGSLVQPLISSVVKGVGGRRIKKAGRIYMDKIFFFNYEPTIGQKIVRLAPLSHLFNVGCKFLLGHSSRPPLTGLAFTDLSKRRGGSLGIFEQV